MSSIRKRMTRELIERLNSAAHRHRLPSAEVARRAFRKYRSASAIGVVELPEREETTRDNSQSMVFHGIDGGEAMQEFAGQILAWYLNNNDKGVTAHISEPEVEELHRRNGQYIVEEATE